VPDVSIYVALITTGAGVVIAAIPHITAVVRDVRLADRDRQERRADARRQACLDLLRAAGDLRTQVANALLYRGNEMGTQLAEITNSAAAVQLHAVSVGLARESLAQSAELLAAAARDLAAATVQNTDMSLHQVVESPDCAEFDGRVTAFRLLAVADAAQ
jgi:hypothetical protein